jgi:hypothetical protein
MRAWAAVGVLLFGVLVSTAVADEDPEAPEVTDCEIPHNESRADQCLFINDEANNVRHPHRPVAQRLTRVLYRPRSLSS